MERTLIHNAVIVNEGTRSEGYVAIDGAIISEVGFGTPEIPAETSVNVIDAKGAMLLPGAIDTHVHFREPGLTRKATIATESMAAAAGGVTSFLDMPNTIPQTTTVEALNDKKTIAAATSAVNYGFFIGATNDNVGMLLSADYSGIPGVKLFLGSSTGNMLVDSSSSLNLLFEKFRGVIAVHAEHEPVIRANRERLIRELGEDIPVTLHSLLRSREACLSSSTIAVGLARNYGTRLHLLHISTSDELSLLSPGKITAKHITAETCPHYLTFTAADLAASRGYVRKCNPAIKGLDDRAALIRAVADDLIDVIATDHAPHLLEEKQGTLFTAASGMPGIKFMLPLMLDQTLTSDSLLSAEQVVEKTSHNPALLYGINRRGFIRKGYYADLVLAAPGCPREIHDTDAVSHLPSTVSSPYSWTPYAGTPVTHRILSTFVNGVCVFNGTSITSHAPKCAMELRFSH